MDYFRVAWAVYIPGSGGDPGSDPAQPRYSGYPNCLFYDILPSLTDPWKRDTHMQIKGQERALEYLEQLLRKDTLPPAMLLYGPEGSGRGRLALDFAARLLCGKPDGPCGTCPACVQVKTLRHPDLLLFSGRDLDGQLDAWRAAAPTASPEAVSRALLLVLYRIEQAFSRGFFKIKKTVSVKAASGRKKSEKLDPDGFTEYLYSLEKQLEAAADAEGLVEIAEELSRLTRFLPAGTLPVDGIRKIIALLGRRPLLGGRRIVIIEEAEQLRQEAANAFLKTLEEPSQGTLIILTTRSHKNVISTIRSRCALVPVYKMRAAEMESLLGEEFGAASPPSAEGSSGFYSYLNSCSPQSRAARDLLVRLFECLEEGETGDGFFALAKEAADGGLAVSLLEEVEELLSQTLLARQTGIGDSGLFIHLLDGIDTPALGTLRAETETVLGRLPVFHLNPAQAVLSLYFSLYQARWSGGC